MELSIQTHANYTVIAPVGRIDTTSAPVLEKELLSRIGEKNHCILDFAEVTYISSLGLRTVMVAAKSSSAHGCQLILCNMTGVVRGVFEISGFNTILNIVADLPAAVAKLDAGA